MDHKDILKLIDTTKGFQRELNGSGHYTVRRHGRRITTISKSPGDHRTAKNTISVLRRAGLPVPR